MTISLLRFACQIRDLVAYSDGFDVVKADLTSVVLARIVSEIFQGAPPLWNPS
jgi:hypothetical protein